jgi:DNA-directed RNA polymerase subunit K/omega
MKDNLLSSLSEETQMEMEKGQTQPITPEEKQESVRRDFLAEDFRERVNNIYEAIIVMSQRARQIGQKQARIVEQFMSSKVRTEDDDDEAVEVIKPSLEDDDDDEPSLPRFEKPTITAMNEMFRGDLKFNRSEEES